MTALQRFTELVRSGMGDECAEAAREAYENAVQHGGGVVSYRINGAHVLILQKNGDPQRIRSAHVMPVPGRGADRTRARFHVSAEQTTNGVGVLLERR